MEGIEHGSSDLFAALDLEAEDGLGAPLDVDDGAAIEAAIAGLLEVGLGAGDEADGPALEFIGGGSGEALGLGEIVGDAADLGVDAATVAEAAGHEVDGEGFDIDAEPAAVEVLCRLDGRAATTEGVEDEIAFVTAGFDDALEEGERLLRGVTEAFFFKPANGGKLRPPSLRHLTHF